MSESKPPYVMPEAKVGQTVLFSKGPDDPRTSIGFVMSVSPRCLGINVLDENWANLKPTDGVRHVSDPDLNHPSRGPMIMEEGGVWRYTEETLENQELRRLVEELSQRLEAHTAVLKEQLDGQAEIISRLSRDRSPKAKAA